MILTILFFILLSIEVILLLSFEKRIWGTYFTPFSFLSIPYTIVLLLVLIFAPSLGFFNIYWPSILVWIIGLFVFWIPSLLFGIFVFKKTGSISEPFINIILKKDKKNIYKLLALILLVFVYRKVFILANVYSIGSDDFVENISIGLVAHLSIILKLIFIYLIIVYSKKDYFSLLIIILTLFYNTTIASKSGLLIPVITALVIRNLINSSRINLSIKKIIEVLTYLQFLLSL